MLTKLLIANRGEIACRIIKTARRMGIRTVAVYSDADAQSLHVQMADEAVHIGPSPSKDSYLQAGRIIDVAKQVGADMIHPGYGFLSENATFSRLCKENNIVFIGPPVGAIEAMGSKSAAKQIMEKAGVPLVPGYHGEDQSADLIKKHSDEMGYPVLLKAAAGGGGKGMRQVWSEAEFKEAFEAAKREAMSSFGDDKMLVEKYLTKPRHVEFQVFCDQHKNGVYLFERDCSVQRRHQKIIEEAPAFGMSEELRAEMGKAALLAAEAINYEGAGTVEFLLDEDGSFYFMEMNTRLQVEHPVTECITGLDLVEWQIRVASGETLPLKQSELSINGHAFEARIYAEDPDNDFLPATGNLAFLEPPTESEHVRVDTGVRQGDDVSIYYDPMIAKLIVWDEDRTKALARMRKALTEYRINGVVTNIEFLYNLANCEPFKKEEIDTGFIDKHSELLFSDEKPQTEEQLALAGLLTILNQVADSERLSADSTSDIYSPWQNTSGWRANETHQQSLNLDIAGNEHNILAVQTELGGKQAYTMTINGRSIQCSGSIDGSSLTTVINGHRTVSSFSKNGNAYVVFNDNGAFHFEELQPDLGIDNDADAAGGFTAPMNGTVVAHLVEAGQTVEKGQPLIVMEAMKMEHSLKAPTKGQVTEFFYQAGDLVDGGAELLSFAAEAEDK
ncbi:acetyl/propionyl/methylcrotonyl-CoA carboxylase subunit alpha [Alteromonadaceae bacterium M269]|nr:acetyl/propionyl/methylcrotonyl-CoA carboxylase subunit alpha [Alteromonadaceae bacterium M269]